MVANAKDVVIRFTGQNLVGPVIQGLQKQLNDLATASRKPGMINLTGTVGQALDAQAKMIRQQKEFQQWVRTQARQGPSTEDVARRAIARRDKWMEVFLNPDEAARGWTRFGSASEVAFARAGRAATNYGAAFKKAFAGIGLAAGVGGDLLGGSGGGPLGAIGNIAGQAALGGFAAGPVGALAFGGVGALREIKQYAEHTKEIAKNREKAARAAIEELRASSLKRQEDIKGIRQGLPQPSRGNEFQVARAKLTNELESARNRLSNIIDFGRRLDPNRPEFAEQMGVNRQQMNAVAMERDLALRELQRVNFQTAAGGLVSMAGRAGGRGLGGLSRGISGGIGALSGIIRQPAIDISKFIRNTQEQLRLEQQLASPAEQMRREMNNLERMKREGIIGESQFVRARRQLGLQAIAGLSEKPFQHLTATESRSLTSGVAQKPVDELKQLLHADLERQEKVQREMLEVMKNKGQLDVVIR